MMSSNFACAHGLFVQLTLEQHGFELRGATYTWIFSVNNSTVVPHGMQCGEYGDAERHTQRAHWKVTQGFSTRWGPAPQPPCCSRVSCVSLLSVCSYLLPTLFYVFIVCPFIMES